MIDGKSLTRNTPVPRLAALAARERLAGFPILTIAGPRQSGKTTLSRLLAPDVPYFSLEDPDTRAFATEDPRAFLRQAADGAIFDEVQRVPTIFSYLKGIVDGDRRRSSQGKPSLLTFLRDLITGVPGSTVRP